MRSAPFSRQAACKEDSLLAVLQPEARGLAPADLKLISSETSPFGLGLRRFKMF